MTETLSATEYDVNVVYEIPLADIQADEEFNCRGLINPGSVIELSKDIQTRGLDQPITIRPSVSGVKKFQLVAGFRRFKATRLIDGATTIRCLVRPMDDITARVLNLRENIQRQDLTIQQEALAIGHLIKLGREDIAKRVGKSSGWVQTRLYVLNLPTDIQREAAAGLLNNTQIRECSLLNSPDDQYAYVRKIKDKILDGQNTEEVKPTKKKPELIVKTRVEMSYMIDLLLKNYGACVATKTLAWASGAIPRDELITYLKMDLEKNGEKLKGE